MNQTSCNECAIPGLLDWETRYCQLAACHMRTATRRGSREANQRRRRKKNKSVAKTTQKPISISLIRYINCRDCHQIYCSNDNNSCERRTNELKAVLRGGGAGKSVESVVLAVERERRTDKAYKARKREGERVSEWVSGGGRGENRRTGVFSLAVENCEWSRGTSHWRQCWPLEFKIKRLRAYKYTLLQGSVRRYNYRSW